MMARDAMANTVLGTVEEDCEVYLVVIGGEHYFVFGNLVIEVVNNAVVATPPPPCLPAYCVGSIEAREGQVKTVDLRIRFGFEPASETLPAVLVIEATECYFGLVVDEVRGKHSIEAGTTIYKALPLANQPPDLSFNGSIEHDGQMVRVLCLKSALGVLHQESRGHGACVCIGSYTRD